MRFRASIAGLFTMALALMTAVSAVPATAAAACDTMSALSLRSGAVTLAQVVTAGTFVPPAAGRGRGGTPPPYADLPEFCRVAATLRPSSDSAINIEIWMPTSGWNGKLEAIGGQGWAGTIGYAGLRDALRRPWGHGRSGPTNHYP